MIVLGLVFGIAIAISLAIISCITEGGANRVIKDRKRSTERELLREVVELLEELVMLQKKEIVVTKDIQRQGVVMAGELDRLREEVTENQTVVGSAIVLLHEIKRLLDEAIASGDMTQVQALAEQLSNQTDELAAAVAATTPTPPPVEG